MFQKEVLLVFTTTLIASSYGARILAYIPIPSYSHQIAFQPLWRELSLRGHHVVSLTTHPIRDESLTNLTEIDLSFTNKRFTEGMNVLVESDKNTWEELQLLAKVFQNVVDEQLGCRSVQELIKNEEEKFDLFIVEYWLPAAFAFAHRFKCPFIGVISVDAYNYFLNSFGNPINTAIHPELMLPFERDLTFPQRLLNSFVYVFVHFRNRFFFIPQQDQLIVKHFGADYPSGSELITNASLGFANGEPIFHLVKPLVPAIIQIGGQTHTKGTTKQLPKELKNELDNATQGFIYFSLGTNVKSNDIANKTRDTIMETFSELPYKILWKYEGEELPNKPSNVITYKWLPQQQVLKHPNIKLFITQGGIQSANEALYSYVPLVGMPFYADQPSNVHKIVSRGLGLSVDHNTLDKEKFKSTILEVINNPQYRINIKELVDLAKDEPMTGLERAVWWTEYVIRHKGARHLRSPYLDIPWYQYFLLDVIGVLVFVFLSIIFLLVLLVKLLLKVLKFVFRRERKLKKH